jgi:hypothetical protein
VTHSTITALLAPAQPEVALVVCRDLTAAWPVAAYAAREHWEVLGSKRMFVGADMIACISTGAGQLVPVDQLPGLLRVQPATDDFPDLDVLLAEVAAREPAGRLGLGGAA